MSQDIMKDISYPSLYIVLHDAIKKIIYQAGIVGVILTIAVYPYYNSFVTLLHSYNISERVIFTIIMFIAHTGTFISVAGYYLYCDYYKYNQQYKMNRKPSQMPSQQLIIRTFAEMMLNHFVTSPAIAYFMFGVFTSKFGMKSIYDTIPSYDILFRDYIRAHIFNDIGFYFTHRLLHHPIFYTKFHKQHHEYKGTISIAAEYANPVESLLSNVIPSLGGVLFFQGHPLVIVIWLALRLRETYEAHSGYCFQGSIMDKLGLMNSNNAIHHDHHHTANQGNYGSLYLDYVFGTMDLFVSGGGYEGYLKKKVKD